MAKETPAQHVERLKKEKAGIDVIKDIHRYAQTGEELDLDDIARFKWYGMYTQNKVSQADDDDTLYFMMRIKLPQGHMNVEQMRALSEISKDFARGTANLTTRHDLQFHFIQIKNVPEIFQRLEAVGLSTLYAAGDVPRNIATCPAVGLAQDEIYNVKELTESIHNYFNGNRDLVNLPRKYKVGISGCAKHCMGHEIQDLAFTAVKFDDRVLFDVCVGGGLASSREFSMHIGYALPEQVLDIAKVVTDVYRDDGLRQNRRKERLGHLIKEWGLEKFKARVEEILGFNLIQETRQEYTTYSKREHYGVYSSKVEGQSFIGCSVDGGYVGSKGLENLANAMQKNGATTIKVAPTQSIIVTDVANENVESLVKDLELIGIDANPNPFKARILACSGLKYCKFAISETKDNSIALTKYLYEKFPDFKETISISLNGCTNSCSYSNIVNIGLVGAKLKNSDGETVTGFNLLLGGNLEGNKSVFGQKAGIKVEEKDLFETVENLIQDYIKSNYKTFHDYALGRVNE
jgi:sulfite reductase (ferredoxin)